MLDFWPNVSHTTWKLQNYKMNAISNKINQMIDHSEPNRFQTNVRLLHSLGQYLRQHGSNMCWESCFFLTCYWWIRTLRRLQLNGQQFGVKSEKRFFVRVSRLQHPQRLLLCQLPQYSIVTAFVFRYSLRASCPVGSGRRVSSTEHWPKFVGELDFLWVECTGFCVRNTY